MIASLSNEGLIYPGEYVPMPNTVSLLNQYTTETGANPVVPVMNMTEGSESFSFEMIIPGIKRENIIIHSNDNILSITVIPIQKKEGLDEKQLVHEFDDYLMERHITLPENADMEFISAEYKMGVLKLHIPKSTGISGTCHNQIVVY